MEFLINDIYRATEGEGVFVGRSQVFVRFQGCNIGCVNCDSMDTWSFDIESTSLNTIFERILEESYQGKINWISITGGDPLHPKHVPSVVELTKFLKSRGFKINLEAAGTRVVDEVFDLLDYISYDLKTPSTGVRTRLSLIEKMAQQYPNRFQMKAVIADRKDFEYTLSAYRELESKLGNIEFPWVLTPCYEPSEEFPMQRFIDIQEWNQIEGGPFRVIGQQHKWIFGADKKSV
ncbi:MULTISPECIES: 4Fe-4S cluster-binding domain-containing protein [Halobacteriovorax]|uniref:7-carboxy-7-deazaguanine synthase n=1 Tax=Halobacteriovorax vibrionivorans TaxID=2152716 RepID=A0ABY0ID34_9BACT|nr:MULTISPECIES: 4Fe-4S cluster-binding domain-containing protein [Halobacteriovorax]RZF20863.1 4Fe-4S cluster-binding domain-containing protein [Halobacteriovorax vibrionivorans]TGD48247.1 4Fe-4S cluster-binding domain-containing protein [Halobacteriovorax sp. Y22]